MKVKGIQTIKEVKVLDVEIDPVRVLYDIYWNLMKDRPEGAEYIRDGYWYVHYFYDYHKGYDVEKKDRPATEDELKIYNAYETLKKAYNDK